MVAKDIECCPYCHETGGKHACNCWDPTYRVIPTEVRTYPELIAEKDAEIEQLRRFRDVENPILSDEVRRLRKEGERKDAEIEQLRGMVRIPLAVHDKDAAEYIKRLRGGDLHDADREPIAELVEKFGSELYKARREIMRLRGALVLARTCINDGGTAEGIAWCLKQIDDAYLSQKEGE